MKGRDIVIGVVVLALFAGFIYLRQRQTNPDLKVPEQEQTSTDTQARIEEKFNVQIPDDVEKAELKDQREGDGSAIATRDVEDGKASVNILADLPDPENGMFYQAWAVKGEEGQDGFERLSLGRLRVAKGGWVLEYSTDKSLDGFDKLQITLEQNADNTPEEKVLEGSF